MQDKIVKKRHFLRMYRRVCRSYKIKGAKTRVRTKDKFGVDFLKSHFIRGRIRKKGLKFNRTICIY